MIEKSRTPKFQQETEEPVKPKLKAKKKQRSILKNRIPTANNYNDERENEIEYQPSTHVIQSVKNWLEKAQDDLSSQTSEYTKTSITNDQKTIRKSKSFKADDDWIRKNKLNRTGETLKVYYREIFLLYLL